MTATSWRLLTETLEARILHSADLSPLGGSMSPTLHPAANEATLTPVAASATTQATTQRTEIAFIDAGLPDADALAADLLGQQAAGRRIEVVTLDASADGLALISQTLAGRSDIGAVHVLSHGSDGHLQLGRTALDAHTLMQRAGEIAGWSQALSPDADLLLYGCDVAQGATGRQLVQDLAALTGADVAASTDLTGAAARGGDWALEYRTGAVQTALAPSLWAQTQWQGVLATYTVTTTTDAVSPTLLAGSLRWAISQANANPGTDTIVFAANGTFNIAAGSGGGDDNSTGDFDITDSVNIVGNGSANTVINGNGLDRVFDVRNAATASFTGLTIQGGASNRGAGVRIITSANATMQDVVVRNNAGSGDSKGSGIYADGSLTLSRTLVQNNTGGTAGKVYGAGIYTSGTLVATDVEILGNLAGTRDGGGLYIDSSANVTLQNVTLADNRADKGGGIYNHSSSTALGNVTLSGNTALNEGGGLWADRDISLDHVTVAYNTVSAGPGKGSGVFDSGGRVQTQNSLFANNAGGNVNLALISQGYNLSDDNSSGFLAVGDQRNTAANAGALASNGGFTRTVAIGSTSAARDAANPVGAPAADQRGVATFGGRSDIGAYEYSPLGFPPTISAVANQTINEDQTLAPVGFTIGDPETSPGSLLLGATSSNTALVPTANIVFGGSGASRTVSLTPAPNANGTTNGGTATITLTVSDGSGSSSTSFVVTVLPQNDAPSGSVTIGGTPTQGQTLTAANTLADVDGLGTISYQWKANGVAISGATGSTLLLAQAQVGQAITVTARYTDGGGTPESVTSAATAAVANLNDLPTGALTIDGTATRLQTLTLTNTLADADGLGPISYQWAADGVDIAGATGTSLLLDSPQVGKTITVRASYTDGFGTPESVSSAATAVVTAFNNAPSGSVTISGTPMQGQTLTAANTLADVDGLGTIAYQWFADGAAISGATGSTLLLAQAQVGQAISVTASYTDGGGTAENVSSATTAAVANVNDAPSSSVTVSGTPAQGRTLTAANTLADVDGLGAIAYQWFADGAAISGATGDSLQLSQAQVGQAISVTASYIDGFGTAESVSSATTAAVANVNDGPGGSVTVSGTPAQGQTLTAANTLADIDGLGSIAYQWFADGAAISGATGDSLQLSQAQVGQEITVTASYIDGFGTTESVASEATEVVDNVNDAATGSVTLSGTPAQGQTLTAANTLADVDGLGTISYQWFADGAAISGATGDSLQLSQAQVGQAISVTASYIDGFDTTESVTSAMSAAVANINDAPVLAHDLADQTTTQGETLQFALPPNTFTDADPGDTLNLVASLANGKALPQWMRFDAASQTFVVSPPLGGTDGPVAVRVVATDASGASAQLVFAVVVLPAPAWAVMPDLAAAVAAAAAATPELEPESMPAATPAAPTEATPAATQADETPTSTDEIVVGGSEASSVSRAALASAGPAIRIGPPPALQVAEVPKSRPSSRTDAVLGFEAAADYSNLAVAQWSQLLKGDDVLRKLDELQRQMAESTDGQRTVVASSVVVTAGLSAGYVVWLVRGGVLVSSMLSALPAWQLIDPMPVLAAASGAGRRRDAAPADEPEVERLFGDDPQATPHESATAAPDTADAAHRATPPSTQAHP